MLCAGFSGFRIHLLETGYRGDIMAEKMKISVGKSLNMVGYYVTRKNVTTVNRKLMNFGTWLDVNGHFFDTTHFPPSLARYPFQGKGVYAIRGKIVEDFGFPSMEVEKMVKLPFVKDERY